MKEAFLISLRYHVVSLCALASGASALHLRSASAGTSDNTIRVLQTQDVCTKECCQQYSTTCGSESTMSSIPFAAQIIMIIVLISLSAAFAGLTLGLMSLDKTGLEIVMEGDDAETAQYARRIYPLRENGNQLLCTLIVGNVAINALLSILLADKAGGVVGFITSTTLIVVLGEIVPQALCSRYPLRIGSASVPLVRVMIVLLYVVVKPLAWCLDKVLGKELPTTYSSTEMLKLLQIQVQEKVLDQETAVAMTGALKYKNIAVSDVMTKLDNTFMLSADEKLNFELIAKIFKTGYSRIPVYEVSKNNVIGLLFVKDLIFIDPEDETRLADFIQIFGRGVHVVWPDDKLGDVLRELKQGRSHMALVRDVNHGDGAGDPYYEIKGIITLEDIIEEILGHEIVDETDAFVDGTHSVLVDREQTFEWARLRLLDSKIVDEKLSFDETRAVTAHLWKNYPDVVALMTENQLCRLIQDTPVSLLPTADLEVGKVLPDELLYERGVPSDACTLILAGKVTVLAGSDGFRSDVSSWSLLGAGALTSTAYEPDFSAYVSSGPCRCVRITRSRYALAVDASAMERHSSHNNSNQGEAGDGGGDVAAVSLSRPDKEESELKEYEQQGQSRKTRILNALHIVGYGDHKVDVARASKMKSSLTEAAATLKESEDHKNPSIPSASRPIQYIDSSSKRNVRDENMPEK